MLIHCVAEEAFWLLGAFVNGVLREYYSKDRTGLRIDASVFAGVLWGSEPKLARLFRDVGVQRESPHPKPPLLGMTSPF